MSSSSTSSITYYRTLWSEFLTFIKQFTNQEREFTTTEIQCILSEFVWLVKLAKHEIDEQEENRCLEIANTGLDCCDLFFMSVVQMAVPLIGLPNVQEIVSHADDTDPFLVEFQFQQYIQ